MLFRSLDVARGLAERGDCVTVIAGDGPEMDRLKALVSATSQLSDAIILLGFIPRSEAIALRLIASVNLVPMGGYSLIEAVASGRPTVSYDIEWHSELIEDCVTGRLVREHDTAALQTAVEELLDSEEYAAFLGRNGQNRAFDMHDIDCVSRRRAVIYNELIAHGNE